MFLTILTTFLFALCSLVLSLPSPQLQDHSSALESRQAQWVCDDVGAAANKPSPDPLQPVGSSTTSSGQKVATFAWKISERGIIVRGACKWMHVINDKWPPPPIIVEQGTIIKLEVTNKLNNDPITLHAHGLDQSKSQWMDGPEWITQKGILPNKKFTYEYDTSKELPGTYWIHNHVAGQYPKGLRAPLIIKAKESSNEESHWTKTVNGGTTPIWDRSLDQILTLSDWFSQDWRTWESLYNTGGCGAGVEVPPIDFLVNDLRADRYNMQTYDFRTTKAAPKSGRIRIINTSAFTTFFVYMAPLKSSGVSDIQLKVIEADGVLMDGSKNAQVVEVAPGQRLSVLVDPDDYAINLPKANTYRMVITVNPYEWLHVQMKDVAGNINGDCYQGDATIEDLKKYPQLHFLNILLGDKATALDSNSPTFYEKHKILEDSAAQTYRVCFLGLGRDCVNNGDYPISTNFADFDDLSLKPIDNQLPTLPSDPNARFLVQTWEESMTRYANLRVILSSTTALLDNDQAFNRFTPQTTPALELLRQGKSTYDDFNAWKNTMIVPENSGSYIVALYSKTGTHPIHLHGHKFRVLYRERQQTSTETSTVKLKDRLNKIFTLSPTQKKVIPYEGAEVDITSNSSPLMRDTVTLYKNGLIVLLIKADNPGAWFLHCHNDFHAHTGMATMVLEKPAQFRSDFASLTAGEQATFAKVMSGSFDSA